MSSGRGTAFAGAALALATCAVVAVVLAVDEPRPVDVRRVDLSPVEPGVLSATYTTTVAVQRSTTPLEVLAPPPLRPAPAPPVTTTTGTTTTEPPPPPPTTGVTTTTPTTTAARHPWSCHPSYEADGACVPLRFPRHVRRHCEWLRALGVTGIRVVGPDHHHLDADHDGRACESRQ
ncbi:hypothetical protein [Saccharothrix syringae]|uniref:Excalibur calcium-binding domain-containing protein n=1 Tax=Saccharothrix syringae TaxID=103733 RepID=A0A5Q0HCV6_SACSY|nr:hypothetical protein [Saccharothrix syringae]QFZ23650.1 hypothetical protein EKG83_44995 [Saccharothrix syringae]